MARRSSPRSTGPPRRPLGSGGSAKINSCSGGASPKGGAPAPFTKVGISPACRSNSCASAFKSAPGSEALVRSEEHTSELQSLTNLVCRLLLEKKKKKHTHNKPSQRTR